MAHGDSSWAPDSLDAPSSQIRAARAQVEAARRRQERLFAGATDGAPGAGSMPGYTLVRELHRGGQGVVYLAVQESTGRQVAIKVLSQRAAPGFSAAGVARFEREVRALSLLKHPNVVTIHDCGRGRDHVYLVMDYVNGRPLDVWAREERPPVRGALALFARVCDAVGAAHLRGVIHRDLKPGNILVDERGEPRVLDFGLAKLTDEARESSPTMTETGQFVGSLPWASPEQAEGRAEALDLRTDVYSLGVVLYQVLTGRFPYPVSGPLPEVVRRIAHSAPARPSQLDPEVGRELETILLKCLAKEPERRYQSAGDLGRDVRRYLAGEAIEARRDSLGYVIGKQVARHRVLAAAAGAVLLVLVGALAVSVTLWRRAEHQRVLATSAAGEARRSAERADREAEQARSVVGFMREVLTSVEPENQGANVRLIDVLARASGWASRRFAGHPEQEAEVRDLLARGYDKLGMWPEAAAQYRAGLELWRSAAGPDDPRALNDEANVAGVALSMYRLREAEEALTALIPRLVAALGPDERLTLLARRNLAAAQAQRGRLDEAEATLLELRKHPRLAQDDPALARIAQTLLDVARSRRTLGPDSPRQGIPTDQEEALSREWLERAMRAGGPDAAYTLQARVNLAEVLGDRGQDRAAAEVCRDVLARTRGRLPDCHDVRSIAMTVLARALSGLGEFDEPAELYLRRIACLRESGPADSPVLLSAMCDALGYLSRAGRGAEGEAMAREVAAALRRLGGHAGSEMTFEADLYVANFVSMQQRLAEAEGLFAELGVEVGRQTEARVVAIFHLFHGCHLMRLGRFEEAEAEMRYTEAWSKAANEGLRDPNPEVRQAFAALYEAWGKPEQAAEYRAMLGAAGK